MSVTDDLYRVYAGAVPQDVTASDLGIDVGVTIATMMAAVDDEVARLAAGTSIATAVGGFLAQLARDEGLSKQDGETDDQLRERLRTPPKAGTVSAIMDALTQIVGDGVILIELPRQGWFFDRQSAFFDRSFTVLDRTNRFGGGRGVVIALIPATADAVASVTDALRSKVSAGKIWFVEEYTVS